MATRYVRKIASVLALASLVATSSPNAQELNLDSRAGLSVSTPMTALAQPPVFVPLLSVVVLDDRPCPGASRAVKDFFHLWLSLDLIQEERIARRISMWMLGLQDLPEAITAVDVYRAIEDGEKTMGLTMQEAADALHSVTENCATVDLVWLIKYYFGMKKAYGEEIYNEARMRRLLASYERLTDG